MVTVLDSLLFFNTHKIGYLSLIILFQPLISEQ